MAFHPRTVFPTLDSLPRSYYLGHHAAGLAKMRTLLNQTDLVIECRDYRIPFSSRNPLFEEVLAGRERIIVYTKKDLGDEKREDSRTKHEVLRKFHFPTPICLSDFRIQRYTRRILDLIKERSAARQSLTGAHCMVVGMPNVGKSSLLNALRATGLRKGKVARTGAQPGVTRKIGTGVKIIEADDKIGGATDVYLLDTPGVFIPYVPDADAMLKLALCGSVKDTVIAPFTLADYLLYHINLNHDPATYETYCAPTNDITELLKAIATKTGRLMKGGEPDLDATAMWMVQRWRNGYLGRFLLDEVSEKAMLKWKELLMTEEDRPRSLSQARRAEKEAARIRSKSRNAPAAG